MVAIGTRRRPGRCPEGNNDYDLIGGFDTFKPKFANTSRLAGQPCAPPSRWRCRTGCAAGDVGALLVYFVRTEQGPVDVEIVDYH